MVCPAAQRNACRRVHTISLTRIVLLVAALLSAAVVYPFLHIVRPCWAETIATLPRTTASVPNDSGAIGRRAQRLDLWRSAIAATPATSLDHHTQQHSGGTRQSPRQMVPRRLVVASSTSSNASTVSLNTACNASSLAQAVVNASHVAYTLFDTLPASPPSATTLQPQPCQIVVADGVTNFTLRIHRALIRGIVFAKNGTTHNVGIWITSSVSIAPLYICSGSYHHFLIQDTRFVFDGNDTRTADSFRIVAPTREPTFQMAYVIYYMTDAIVEDANVTLVRLHVDANTSGAVEGGLFRTRGSLRGCTIVAEHCTMRWMWADVDAPDHPDKFNATGKVEVIILIQPQAARTSICNMSIVAQVSEAFSMVFYRSFDDTAAVGLEDDSTINITDATVHVLVQGPRRGDPLDLGRQSYRRSVGIVGATYLLLGGVVRLQRVAFSATIVPQRAALLPSNNGGSVIHQVADEAYCSMVHFRSAQSPRTILAACTLHCVLPNNASIPFGLVQSIGFSLVGIETHRASVRPLSVAISDCRVTIDVLSSLCPYERDVFLGSATRIVTGTTTLFVLMSVVYCTNVASLDMAIQGTTLVVNAEKLARDCFMVDSPATVSLFGNAPQSTTMASVLAKNTALVLLATSGVQSDVFRMFVDQYWRDLFMSVAKSVTDLGSGIAEDGTQLHLTLRNSTMEVVASSASAALEALLHEPLQFLRIQEIAAVVCMSQGTLNQSVFHLACNNVGPLPMLAMFNVSIGDGLVFDGSGNGSISASVTNADHDVGICAMPSNPAPYMAVLINCTSSRGSGTGGGSSPPSFHFSNISEGVLEDLHAAVLLLMCSDLSHSRWRFSHVSWRTSSPLPVAEPSAPFVATAPPPEGSVFLLVDAYSTAASMPLGSVALHCVLRNQAVLDRRVVSVPHWAVPDAVVAYEAPCEDPGLTRTAVQLAPQTTAAATLSPGLTALVAASYAVPHVNPSLSMVQMAVRALRLSQKCRAANGNDREENDDDETPFLSDVVENPLQLHVGSALPPTMTTAAGAVLGNALVCGVYILGSFVFALGAVMVYARTQDGRRRAGGRPTQRGLPSSSSVRTLVGRAKHSCGVAGALMVPYSAMAQPVASAASGLLTFAAYGAAESTSSPSTNKASHTAIAVVFAVLAIAIVVAPCICWLDVVLFRWSSSAAVAFPLQWHVLPRSDVVARPGSASWARLSRLERFACYVHRAIRYPNHMAGWRVVANTSSSNRRRTWWYDGDDSSCVASYAQIVEPFRPTRCAFFVVEVLLDVLTGVVLGIGWVMAAHGGACTWALWLLLAVAVLWVVLLAALRPYASLLDNLNAAAIAVLSCLAVALEIGGADDAAATVATVEMALSFLFPAAQLLHWLLRWWFVLAARSKAMLGQLMCQGNLTSPLLGCIAPSLFTPPRPVQTKRQRSLQRSAASPRPQVQQPTQRSCTVMRSAEQNERLTALVQLICDGRDAVPTAGR